MIRYDSIQYEPPAPIADLEISNPATHHAERGLAKIDSGADISIIPAVWVTKLRLLPAGFSEVASFNGTLTEIPAYYVNISMNGFTFEYVRVLSSNRTNALIGRDILNQLKVTLDGKALKIQVLDP